MELHKEREKSKILKALESGSTRLAYTVTSLVCRHSFILEPARETDSINIHLLAYRTAYLSSSYFSSLSSSLLPYLTLLSSSLLLG